MLVQRAIQPSETDLGAGENAFGFEPGSRNDLSREFREVVQADRNASSRLLWAREEASENNAKVSAKEPAGCAALLSPPLVKAILGRLRRMGHGLAIK